MTRIIKALAPSTICAAALTLAAGNVEAQTIGAQAASKEKTYVTFSAPVRIPGAVLPAGEYTLMLANPTFADHQTVEVWQKDGEKVATMLTVPIHRPENFNEQVMLFAAPPGQPPALKAWFYPMIQMGHEFVYSKDEARTIAKAAAQSVAAADLPGSWDTPVTVTVLRIDPAGMEKPDESRTAGAQGRAAESHLQLAEKALEQAAGNDREVFAELRRNLADLRQAYQAQSSTKPATQPSAGTPAWHDEYTKVERTLDDLASGQAVGTTGGQQKPATDRKSLEQVRQHLRSFYQAASGKAWSGKTRR